MQFQVPRASFERSMMSRNICYLFFFILEHVERPIVYRRNNTERIYFVTIGNCCIIWSLRAVHTFHLSYHVYL